jgi:predicted small secreted protein
LVDRGRHARPHLQENNMRKFMGIAAIAGALLVSACNTVEGMGRDVESAGHTVAKTADRSK